jgi:hypothetical protein
MKWLRLSLLLLALIAPQGPANCYADPLDDDVPAKPERNQDQDLDSTVFLSVAGSVVVIALGASFIALRRNRKRNDDQAK